MDIEVEKLVYKITLVKKKNNREK